VVKTIVILVKFLLDVAREKLLKSANVIFGAIQKKIKVAPIYRPRCICRVHHIDSHRAVRTLQHFADLTCSAFSWPKY